jgi:DNA-binding MarR family transcriptional regulator
MSARTSEVAELFVRTVPQVMRVIAADVRRSELAIEPVYVHLLGILAERERSLGELADMLSVSSPTMSKTVSALEARGWVERRGSEEDRRVVLVCLTAKGESILTEARAYMISRLAEVLGSLTDEQRDELADGLSALREAFSLDALVTSGGGSV